VATDGGQGYSDKANAMETVTKLLAGDYKDDITDSA